MAKPRQMTVQERTQLAKLLAAQRTVNWKEHFWLFAAALTLLPGLSSSAALRGLGCLASLAGFPIARGAWRDDPVTHFGAIAVVVAVWLFLVVGQALWLVRWERHRRQRKAKLETDLARDLVHDETFLVTGVKLLREPEHGMILFFLQLSNGKRFVLYDYGSVDTEGEHDGQSPPTLMPGEKFHLLTFPVSKERSWSFSGPAVSLPIVKTLELGPEDWPEDEGWCRVKWENIDRHYGAKKSR